MRWKRYELANKRVMYTLDTPICLLSVIPEGRHYSVSVTFPVLHGLKLDGQTIRLSHGYINGQCRVRGPMIRTRKAATGRRWATRFLKKLLRENLTNPLLRVL